MNRISFLLVLFFGLHSGYLNAQIYWTEDFGTGSSSCNDTQFAVAYSGSNGSWTMTQTGVNGTNANEWYISSTSSNSVAGSCETGCSGAYNQTLHVANIPTSPGASLLCPTGDCGAAYDDSDSTVITSKRIESPTINLSGLSGLQMSFVYIMNGQIGFDYGRIWFFDGVTWVADTVPLITPSCGTWQSKWVYSVINLPSFADNNPNFKIGFEWKNNGDGFATDPSFSIDNIRIANSFVSINEETEVFPFSYSVIDNIVYLDIVNDSHIQIELFDLTGKRISAENDQSAIKLPGVGIYLIRVWVDNQSFVLKVIGN